MAYPWDDIRFFLAVAHCGTVSAAAQKLKINQSTVSRRINAYEEALRVRLFERLTTGYVLTAEGEQMLVHARRMEEESLAIEREVMGKNVALTGPIRVTAPLALSKYLLMPIFLEFAQTYPDIELQIDISNDMYNISQREADVALRVTRDSPAQNLIGRELAQLEFGAFAARKLINAYVKDISRPLPWIGEANAQSRPAWLPNDILKLKRVMRSNDVLITIDAVRAGLGVGRLLKLFTLKEKNIALFPGAPVIAPMPLWMLTHVDMRRVSRVSTFMQFVSTRVRERLSAAFENKKTTR